MDDNMHLLTVSLTEVQDQVLYERTSSRQNGSGEQQTSFKICDKPKVQRFRNSNITRQNGRLYSKSSSRYCM